MAKKATLLGARLGFRTFPPFLLILIIRIVILGSLLRRTHLLNELWSQKGGGITSSTARIVNGRYPNQRGMYITESFTMKDAKPGKRSLA